MLSLLSLLSLGCAHLPSTPSDRVMDLKVEVELNDDVLCAPQIRHLDGQEAGIEVSLPAGGAAKTCSVSLRSTGEVEVSLDLFELGSPRLILPSTGSATMLITPPSTLHEQTRLRVSSQHSPARL